MITAIEFPLAQIYDKLVEEGEYFNYEQLVEVLSSILHGKKEILELCIGTGQIAIRMAAKGFSITGVDNDETMLAILEQKLKNKQFTIVHKNLRAEHLKELGKEFEAIYIHSGHLIFNKNEKGIFLNVPSVNSMIGTFKSVAENLKDSGLFIINIEKWNDQTKTLSDGSIYRRTILEETEIFGTRHHMFFDNTSGKIYSEKVERQPKYSYEIVTGELRKLGFEEFIIHEDMFFVCKYNKNKD